jgi:hypothetical protein
MESHPSPPEGHGWRGVTSDGLAARLSTVLCFSSLVPVWRKSWKNLTAVNPRSLPSRMQMGSAVQTHSAVSAIALNDFDYNLIKIHRKIRWTAGAR